MINRFLIKKLFNDTFTLDARSIILFRILVGLSIIYIFYVYYINIELLAPEANFFKNPNFHNPAVFLNLFRINESVIFIKACLITATVFSVLFIIGIKPRLFAVLLGFFLLSVKNQTGFSSLGFELLMYVILFWCLFFPHQKINLLWNRNLVSQKSNSIIALAWYLQIALFYFFSFLYKADFPEWSTSFNALFIIFQKVNYQTSLTPWILDFPRFLKFLVILTLFLEGIAPFLFLLSASKYSLRMIFIVCYTGFHIGIMLLLDVGAFSPLSIALWMSLLPAKFWDKFYFTRRESEKENESASSHEKRNKKAINLLIITSAFAMVYGNVSVYVHRNSEEVQAGSLIYQKWLMFANENSLNSSIAWLATEAVFEGSTQKPELWDIMNDIPADHNSPHNKSGKYKTYIWRTFTSRILGSTTKNEKFLRSIPRYFCKSWNETHKRKVISVKFVVVESNVQIQNPNKSPKRVRELSSAECAL